MQIQILNKTWTEEESEKHPRGGNPENKGQFSRNPGGADAPDVEDYRGVRDGDDDSLGFGQESIRQAFGRNKKGEIFNSSLVGKNDFNYRRELKKLLGLEPHVTVLDVLRQASDDVRSQKKAEIVQTLAKQTGIGEYIVDDFIHGWSKSSSQDSMSALMQKAVVNLFGGKTSEWQDEVLDGYGIDTIFDRLDNEIKFRSDFRENLLDFTLMVTDDVKDNGVSYLQAYKKVVNRMEPISQEARNVFFDYIMFYADHISNDSSLSLDEIYRNAKQFYDQRMNGTSVSLRHKKGFKFYINNKLKKGDAEKIVKQMYQNTQDHFRSMGLGPDDEITLFRGLDVDVPEDAVGKKALIRGNAIESWSMDYNVAKTFGKTVIARKVKTRNIVSSFLTGFGCMTETEYATLGNENAPVLVVKTGAK